MVLLFWLPDPIPESTDISRGQVEVDLFPYIADILQVPFLLFTVEKDAVRFSSSAGFL
jgi:hypothetical protein